MESLAILAANVYYKREVIIIQRCFRKHYINSKIKQTFIQRERIERYRKYLVSHMKVTPEQSKEIVICTSQCWAVYNLFV